MTPICLANATGLSKPGKTARRSHQDAEQRGVGRRKILCVDDDPVVLSLQRALLEAAGFSVITARDASEAIRGFSVELPDAVVIDYSICGTNGAALAKQLRRIDENVPLILNSGSMEIPVQDSTLFDRLLPKGLAASSLVNVLREMFSLPVGGLPVPPSPESRNSAALHAVRSER